MYKSQFWKIDPYDWFCGPGSQILHTCTQLEVFQLIIIQVNKRMEDGPVFSMPYQSRKSSGFKKKNTNEYFYSARMH